MGEKAGRSNGWESVHLDDLDEIELADGLLWRPVRRRLGIGAFGVNAYRSRAAGELVVEDHDEAGGGAGGHEELYLVVRGRAGFTVDGVAIDAPAGTLVRVSDPSLRRVAIAEEPDTVVLVVGAEPGRAFEVSPWESYFAALPDMRASRWEDAIATMNEGLRLHPGHPALLYNLACAEARGGRSDAAIAHLNEAISRESSYREHAWADADLEAVRARPDFPAAQ